jgi:hypothetical protein
MARWRWSPSMMAAAHLIGWVAVGMMVIALPWSLFRLAHVLLGSSFSNHALNLWLEPDPAIAAMQVGIEEGAATGVLITLWMALLNRGAPRPRQRALALLGLSAARLTVTAFGLGVCGAALTVWLPWLHASLLPDLSLMGVPEKLEWTVGLATTWGWLLGLVRCLVAARRDLRRSSFSSIGFPGAPQSKRAPLE